MSGVIVGTRLQQLCDLKRRIELAIELEARRLALGGRPAHARVTPVTTPASPPPATPRPGSSPESPADELVRVNVRQVRADVLRDWATTNGYRLGRGRIPTLVVEEFASAHR